MACLYAICQLKQLGMRKAAEPAYQSVDPQTCQPKRADMEFISLAQNAGGVRGGGGGILQGKDFSGDKPSIKGFPRTRNCTEPFSRCFFVPKATKAPFAPPTATLRNQWGPLGTSACWMLVSTSPRLRALKGTIGDPGKLRICRKSAQDHAAI